MDREMIAQLDRIEAAFNTLIDSITTYNPSVSAADDLYEADAAFTGGLNRLIEHQNNHLHLLRLRQTATRLDAQIKDTVTKLADARKELLDLPWTEVSVTNTEDRITEEADNDRTPTKPSTRQDGARKVPMHELLSYAQKIAKTSLPPTYRREFDVPERPPNMQSPGKEEEETQEVTQTTNGTPSRPEAADTAVKANATDSTVETKEEAEVDAENEKDDRGPAWRTLNPASKAWLDELKNLPFVPWPNEDLLKSGALASLQRAVERGEDPWVGIEVSSDAPQTNGQDQKHVDEMMHDAERQQRQRPAGGAPGGARPAPQAAPIFTGLGMYDPDADDE